MSLAIGSPRFAYAPRSERVRALGHPWIGRGCDSVLALAKITDMIAESRR
jgi:hypothetical protein